MVDVPMVNLFDSSFSEHHPAGTQRAGRAAGRVFAYPYARTRETLEGMRAKAPDPRHGWKMHFANPVTGAFTMRRSGPAVVACGV
jgi:gentisate 1,2-dioxygenase